RFLADEAGLLVGFAVSALAVEQHLAHGLFPGLPGGAADLVQRQAGVVPVVVVNLGLFPGGQVALLGAHAALGLDDLVVQVSLAHEQHAHHVDRVHRRVVVVLLGAAQAGVVAARGVVARLRVAVHVHGHHLVPLGCVVVALGG